MHDHAHHPRVMTNGRPLSAVSASAFGLSEVRHRAGDLYRTHTHDLPYLLLVLRGAFHEEVRGQVVELTSGGVVVMPAGCNHRDVIDDAGLDALLVTLQGTAGCSLPIWRCFSGGPVSRAMVSLYRSFVEGGDWELLAIEELLHEITSCANGVLPPERSNRRAVRVAMDILHACADQPLRLANVADEAGVAAAYLARAFKRSTGQTMGAYLRSLRARRAATMLASTDAALADVALSSGFADQSHLCRVFAGEYGVTPARYRRLMQKSNSFNT